MNSSQGFLGSVFSWAKAPFQSNGSALNWILFVGLLVIAAWFWNHVLLQIQGEV